MELAALWTLVVVGAGFFGAMLLDDILDPDESDLEASSVATEQTASGV